MKIGLEVEFFVTKKGKLADAYLLGLPHDEYPILAEARGDPSSAIYKAVWSVMGEIARICDHAAAAKAKPAFLNWWPIDDHTKELQLAALRRGITKHVKWENIHGLPTSPKSETHLSAGLHISFTNPREYYDKDRNKIGEYHVAWDFYKTFMRIEKEFEKEIAESERTKGFYEFKSDGRVEYRSLPATLIRDRSFPRRLAACI